MHGPPWLENPILPIMLIAVGFVLLFISIRMKKKQPESEQGYNFELKLFGHKILDTSNRWMIFTAFIGLVAIGSHYLAEYTFHIYDVTPIDRFTHGLSGMAVTAVVLNINLTRGRKVYYPTAIATSWVAFILWEVYEWLSVMFNPDTTIQTTPWDLAIDLWIDSLGALAMCFIYDEFNEDN
jgi:membrane-bound ClpP family serine protease